MDPVWLDNYPPGVPHQIVVNPDRSLLDSIDHAVASWPQRPAFSNMGVSISFAELDTLSRQFAAWLQTETSLQKGDRVALMMPNMLQYPVALFGVLRAGMVVVNVNPMYTARELRHQLEDAGAKAIVVFAGSAHVVAEVLEDTHLEYTVVTNIGDLFPAPKRWLVNLAVRYVRKMIPAYKLPTELAFSETLAGGAARYTRPNDIKGDSLAILQYTGGTTGVSKGAMLSHSNLLANIEQLDVWFDDKYTEGEEIVITALPLYHVYALTVNCLLYFMMGGLNVLVTDPRDTAGLIKTIAKFPFTAITGVNTLFQSLVRHPDFPSLDFSTIKVVSAGGMAVQEVTANAWAEISGTRIIEGYGLSETSPVVSTNRGDVDHFTGSIGLPLPSTLVSIRDEDGNELSFGEPGELCVKGPQVMLGYWNNAEATASVTTPDGYLRTGDMATIDAQGFMRIVDRKKDIIVISGFKVFPNELENTVASHPDVLEAAVIGVDDDDSGEAVKLYAVIKKGSTMTPEDLRLWCRSNMTRYKVPKFVEFIDELPKSNVGKVLRRELRELHGQ